MAMFLRENGYKVLLIGRKLPDSLPVNRPYKTYRMRLLFRSGFLFYATYSICLFFKLLFTKKSLLWANDLDALAPNYLAAKISGKPIVYDSHELFTEIPELTHRPRIRKVWLFIEQLIFPKLKYVITVNKSIADYYQKKYNVVPKVIRNIALKLQEHKSISVDVEQIIINKKVLILQGTGINIGRGAEEAVQMMQYLENAVLFIIGSGDVFPYLKKLAKSLQLENRVYFINKLSYNDLMAYTTKANLGLSLDKGTNLNYEYSLPNKIFDYIQAKTPIFATHRPEVSKIIRKYDVGWLIEEVNPRKMAIRIKAIFENTEDYNLKKENCAIAGEILCWENESKKLIPFIHNIHKEIRS